MKEAFDENAREKKLWSYNKKIIKNMNFVFELILFTEQLLSMS